ncbi:MAG TPA: M1 family aminopeptidase [Candidatus Kryptonia bacterium]
MNAKSLFICFFIVTPVAFAQIKNALYTGGDKQMVSSEESINYVSPHAYDVLKYNLYMDWYAVLQNESLRYNGIMEITFRPDATSPLDSINLDNDGVYLRVDSAFAYNRRLSLNSNGSRLIVYLDTNLVAGDTGVVRLYYHVTNPGLSNSSPQKGFYLYYRDGSTVFHTIAYTMSEPSDAHYWMPCYDDPSDKALSEISVRVPDGFVAASNGRLAATTNNHDGSITYDWVEDFPIATYLMCATVSQFAVVQGTFVRAPGDSIPVQYYVYPEDSAAAVSNGSCDVDSVISMIKFYSSIYGPYPFEKYAMTCIEPFYYGGMEHTTITTVKRNYEFDRRVVAHELAHHWWGDNVTLGTWKDIWLNEGFATYSEAMQQQHLSESDFHSEMQYYEAQFFGEYDTTKYAAYAPPPGLIFGLAEYYKGAWVLHMLRSIVGDSTFFDIMKTYRADFQFGNAVTTDFAGDVSKVTGSDMSWFFNEWIFSPGYPIYSYTYRRSGDTLNFTVEQNQVNAPFFKMPIDLGVYSGGTTSILHFTDSLQLQSVSFFFSGTIDSVSFDPSDKILKLTSPWSDSMTSPSPVTITSFPNPFSRSTTIQYVIAGDSKVTIEVYDILGRKIRSIEQGYQSAGFHDITFDAVGLASGAYLCRIVTAFGDRTTKILLEK